MSRARPAEVVERVRVRLRRRLRVVASVWLASALALVVVLAWTWAGPDGWTQGSWGPMTLDLTLVMVVAGLWGVYRTLGSGLLGERSLARCVDEAAGLGEGTMIGSLELGRQVPDGVSVGLADLAERSVMGRLDLSDRALAEPLDRRVGGWRRWGLGGLALFAPVAVLLAVVSPARWTAALGGLTAPVRTLSAAALPALAVAPGDVEVRRGEPLDVSVLAPGREQVTLHWQSDGDVVRSDVGRPAGDGRAAFRFEQVRAPTRYWASAPDGATTEAYRIVPVDPLFVSDVTVEVTFPPHTGRPPEEYRSLVPPLTLPAGTRLGIVGSGSRALSTAGLLDANGETAVPFAVEGAGFSATWTPTVSGVYAWHFEDDEGASAAVLPADLDVSLVADAPPEVRFTLPARDTVLPLSLRQPLVLQAEDDYGLARMELHAFRVTSGGERSEARIQGLDLGGSRGVIARPLLDVGDWGLLPGDEVRYFARVSDNAPRPSTVETREWVLRVPGAGEMRRQAQQRLEDATREMEELAERAGRSAEETRDLERQAAAQRDRQERTSAFDRPRDDPAAVDFDDREDVRQALERQEGLSEQVDSVRGELDDLLEAMREAGLAQEDLRADLDELQGLLDEIASDEMRQQLEAMREQLGDMDARQVEEALRELSQSQDAFRDRIEESLERFRRAAVQQDFRATQAEAEDLARQEEALGEALREGDDPERRARQQGDLERRAEDMESRMEDLEGRLQELGERDAAADVREARERSAESRTSMAAAQRSARTGEAQQAGDRADEAAEAMRQAASELDQAQQEMAQRQTDAMQAALRTAADGALALARQQSELREQMRGASRDDMAEMRADVAAVRQGVRNLAENVASASQMSGGDERQLSQQMGDAMAALDRTLQAMEQRAGSTPSPQSAAEGAVEALNQLALSAMAGAQQSGQAQGEAQSGGEQLQEQLESLAQQQGELNNQAGQIMPMQLGEQAMRAQMQEMAQGQQSVAGELGRMSEEPGSEGALGDLEALAEEARALAERLAGGRLDPETRQRQERLFHRLLDAGRSLERDDEQSDQRESRTAGAVERGLVAPLGAEATGAIQFRLPDAATLQRLSPAERQLVLRYFERLNRAAGRPEAGGRGPGGGR